MEIRLLSNCLVSRFVEDGSGDVCASVRAKQIRDRLIHFKWAILWLCFNSIGLRVDSMNVQQRKQLVAFCDYIQFTKLYRFEESVSCYEILVSASID